MRRFFPGFLIALIWLLGSHSGSGAARAVTNSISFTENYTEAALCTNVPATGLSCHEVAGDQITISAKLPLSAGESAAFTPATAFDLVLGGFEIHQVLGNDAAYKAGKKAAKFVTTTRNGAGKVVWTTTTRLSWTASLLTITVQGRTSDASAPDWHGILAHSFAGHVSAGLSSSVDGSIAIGAFKVPFTAVPVSGSIVTKDTKARDHTMLSLTKVRIKGSGKGSRRALIGVQAIAGAEREVGSVIAGNEGGTVTISTGALAGTTITVPPGAFAGNTLITLSENDTALVPNSGTFSGKAITIHTDGQTTFEEPLRITIPFPDDGNTIPVPYYVQTNGALEPCQVIAVDHTNHTLTFETFHASLFTWLWAYLTGEGGHTTYSPAVDGFQIVNFGSIYNPGGECFGMCAFEQWFFNTRGGGLYPKYMQNIPVPAGGTVKGQNIIATRAHTSVSRLWTTYVPKVSQQYNLTPAERFAAIANIIDNTARPTILYLSGNPNSSGTHAVLAYDHNASGTLAINDPNYPGTIRNAQLENNTFTYPPYQSITVIGNGSFRAESFQHIYEDAESGFSGNGAAQVDVESHQDGQHVTERTISLAGRIESGQVLVDKLEIWLNGATKFEQAIGIDGFFILPISLVTGENRLTFATKGHAGNNNVIDVPNSQLTPFVILNDSTNSVILVTLTWNTDNTDLDLYTIDPFGDYSAYFHKVTLDGGELDFDDTTGFGPEHWTLSSSDYVQWDGEYDVRVHYYSDHRGENPAPAVATRWTVSVLLYEGTSRAVNYNFTGVLAYDYADNDESFDTGVDWADVCTLVPVQAGGAFTSPVLEKTGSRKARLIIPVPSANERLQIKAAAPTVRQQK